MKHARTTVLAAIAVLVLLASTLGIRLAQAEKPRATEPAPAKLARFTEPPPPAHVPAPRAIVASELTVPCWGCPKGADGPVRFRTDLDLLAPLGDGRGNAALWLKDFAPQVGARAAEWEASEKRRVDAPEWLGGKILPADDPLLREAEPWADQATLRTYPDVFAVEGGDTRLSNLALALTLAKSWVARAEAHPESPAALEDCRRAIRWGRLLRSGDVVLIDDLVGLACIRFGAQGLFDLAQRRGDAPLALVASIVLGEHAPQRLKTAEMVTRLGFGKSAAISERQLADVLDLARSAPDRRFRGEAIVQLSVARVRGSRDQRAKAEAALDELQRSEDPVIRGNARWARTVRELPEGI